MRAFRQLSWIAAACTVAALAAAPAWACGGFFCFTQPVDQSAERILYVQKDGKITVHIQISYTGDDKSFSWVLPLQKAPAGGGLQPSSDSIFQLLEQMTTPQFQLQWAPGDGKCNPPMCFAEDANAGGLPPSASGGGVQVLLQENVGPYKAVVIQGSSGAEVLKWLNDNNYVQPKSTEGLLDTYAKEKFVFLALQLQKDKGAGDLVPIAITLDEAGPCLPIRLTALATAPDMPIVAWVVGKARAIPKNFLHVEINDAAVDWLNAASNYKTVVSKAVDLGSGHAFLTEMAKKTKDVPIQFAQAGWNAADLAGLKDPSAFLQKMLQMQLPRTTQLQGLIKKYIKKDAKFKDVTDQQFYGCIQNYAAMGGNADAGCKDWYQSVVSAGFDAAAMAKDIDELVMAPLKGLQSDYNSLAYVTRLYTTLSAEEMTKDPIFGFNADLPEVSNVHSAQATAICENGSTQATKAKIKFADGKEITYDMPKDAQNNCWGGFGGPAQFGKGTQPAKKEGGQALKKVQVLDESGPALDIDQSAADSVDAQLNNAKLGAPSLSKDFIAKLPKITWDPYKQGEVTTTKPPVGADAGSTANVDAGGSAAKSASSGGSSGMCSSARTASGSWAWMGVLLAGAWAIRRRIAA